MRVGSLVYATDQGLGYLAKSFYDAGVVTDVFVIEHAHHINRHKEWYPSAPSCPIRNLSRQRRQIERFIESVDVLLFFETPFDWGYLEYARSRGKKTFLMPMYECTPAKLPAQPDFFFCPSLLDLRYFPERSAFIPVPVEQEWKQRCKAEVFVHNAGHGGLRNRNGTGELIDAWKLVQSPAKLILRSQKRLQWAVEDPRIELRIGTAAREELYAEGDVFIFPEKFNGLSLPLQESYASGMLVMTTNRFPNNTYLPGSCLIPPAGFTRSRIGGAYLEFDEAIITPEAIAKAVDGWYCLYSSYVAELSSWGRQYGEENSWAALKPRYLEALEKGL